jgi:small subunit ribosomal protein S18
MSRRKVCPFCVDHVEYIDYKQVDMLSRFLSDRGKIKARRKIGTCAKHQRRLAIAIKRARHLAMLPFTTSVAH